jgi:hypothetical protein
MPYLVRLCIFEIVIFIVWLKVGSPGSTAHCTSLVRKGLGMEKMFISLKDVLDKT